MVIIPIPQRKSREICDQNLMHLLNTGLVLLQQQQPHSTILVITKVIIGVYYGYPTY